MWREQPVCPSSAVVTYSSSVFSVHSHSPKSRLQHCFPNCQTSLCTCHCLTCSAACVHIGSAVKTVWRRVWEEREAGGGVALAAAALLCKTFNRCVTWRKWLAKSKQMSALRASVMSWLTTTRCHTQVRILPPNWLSSHTQSALLLAAYTTREKNSSSCWRCSWRLAARDDDYSVREAERWLMRKQLKHGICLLITKTHYRFKLSLHWITQGFCSFMSPYSRDFLKFLYQLLQATITLIVELITIVFYSKWRAFFTCFEGLESGCDGLICGTNSSSFAVSSDSSRLPAQESLSLPGNTVYCKLCCDSNTKHFDLKIHPDLCL